MAPALTLPTILQHIEYTRYAQLASSSIIIYDHLVTFDSEVELIWKANWSKGKVLFILNRYYSLASVIFNNYGASWALWSIKHI
ncbi:hypothetical protein CC2G_003683 [Coprinopsis cinerea AmutBmut pab1-1]|nr:hypothetical protein CC2G_003683 [Coprinopsis cinerea AmutBmut pab1-1]